MIFTKAFFKKSLAVISLLILTACSPSEALTQDASAQGNNKEISSKVDSTAAGELILTQEVIVHAPLETVWDAYTTEAGWAKWSTPLVSMDFRVGGTIKTNYNAEGTLGDETTNTLFIRNYVPYKLLTLQADLAPNWPEFMKEDVEDLYNLTLFEHLSEQKTRIISYGMGYKNNEKYLGLMDFFIQGNEYSYQQLKKALEN